MRKHNLEGWRRRSWAREEVQETKRQILVEMVVLAKPKAVGSAGLVLFSLQNIFHAGEMRLSEQQARGAAGGHVWILVTGFNAGVAILRVQQESQICPSDLPTSFVQFCTYAGPLNIPRLTALTIVSCFEYVGQRPWALEATLRRSCA
jgi:hypothetical protein